MRRALWALFIFGCALPSIVGLVMAIRYGAPVHDRAGFAFLNVWMTAWTAIPYGIFLAFGRWQAGLGSRLNTSAGILLLVVSVFALPLYDADWLSLAAVAGAALSLAARKRLQLSSRVAGIAGAAAAVAVFSIMNVVELWRTSFERLPGHSMIAVGVVLAAIASIDAVPAGYLLGTVGHLGWLGVKRGAAWRAT